MDVINGRLDIAEEKIIKFEDKQQKLSKLNTQRKMKRKEHINT